MSIKPDKHLGLNGKLSCKNKDSKPLIEEEVMQRIICNQKIGQQNKSANRYLDMN
jgi:hypothetical protein